MRVRARVRVRVRVTVRVTLRVKTRGRGQSLFFFFKNAVLGLRVSVKLNPTTQWSPLKPSL